jgi:hypothetical protein
MALAASKEYGQLGFEALGHPDEWSQWVISAEEFERTWDASSRERPDT